MVKKIKKDMLLIYIIGVFIVFTFLMWLFYDENFNPTYRQIMLMIFFSLCSWITIISCFIIFISTLKIWKKQLNNKK